ncbi:hypothetical protein L3Q82_007553 [Scortum barcoo]|uniref:Uncharacterized protein n=1 Tax=Scortum barcoo TaxID=214431 RepID=A0ACB8WN91_9TELE|nr:hypothetical protein L3Q82_007553 [Scortum barcoo]
MYSSLWGVDVPHKLHWTPGETGYTAHIISTISEWSLAFSFISFFLTYIRDFQYNLLFFTVKELSCSFALLLVALVSDNRDLLEAMARATAQPEDLTAAEFKDWQRSADTHESKSHLSILGCQSHVCSGFQFSVDTGGIIRRGGAEKRPEGL